VRGKERERGRKGRKREKEKKREMIKEYNRKCKKKSKLRTYV